MTAASGCFASKLDPWDSHGTHKSLDTERMRAVAGKAFTTVLAGFALTLISWPKAIRVPAFVAGFVLVLMRQSPGMVKTPVFLTSLVAMAARLSKIWFTSLVFNSCSVAMSLTMALLVNLLLLEAFMAVFMAAFFIGAILRKSKGSESVSKNLTVVLS